MLIFGMAYILQLLVGVVACNVSDSVEMSIAILVAADALSLAAVACTE